jgi:hypothetical protein
MLAQLIKKYYKLTNTHYHKIPKYIKLTFFINKNTNTYKLPLSSPTLQPLPPLTLLQEMDKTQMKKQHKTKLRNIKIETFVERERAYGRGRIVQKTE